MHIYAWKIRIGAHHRGTLLFIIDKGPVQQLITNETAVMRNHSPIKLIIRLRRSWLSQNVVTGDNSMSLSRCSGSQTRCYREAYIQTHNITKIFQIQFNFEQGVFHTWKVGFNDVCKSVLFNRISGYLAYKLWHTTLLATEFGVAGHI